MKESIRKITETKDIRENVENKRRGFLKKAAYVAPTLISLGTLLRSTDAKAGFGGPPDAPGNSQNPWG